MCVRCAINPGRTLLVFVPLYGASVIIFWLSFCMLVYVVTLACVCSGHSVCMHDDVVMGSAAWFLFCLKSSLFLTSSDPFFVRVRSSLDSFSKFSYYGDPVTLYYCGAAFPICGRYVLPFISCFVIRGCV